jgi:hypothetical protein
MRTGWSAAVASLAEAEFVFPYNRGAEALPQSCGAMIQAVLSCSKRLLCWRRRHSEGIRQRLE